MLESRLSHLRTPLAAIIIINDRREKEKREIKQNDSMAHRPNCALGSHYYPKGTLQSRLRMHYFQAANFVKLASCAVEVDSQTKDQSQQLLHLPLVLRMTNPYAWQPFILPSCS